MSNHRVKVTIQKKVDPSYIFNGKTPIQPGKGQPYPVCPIDEKSVWIVEKDGKMPEGFCSWAWRDLYKDLAVLRHGGNFGGWVAPPYMFTSCSDGIRPVSFKLEVLED